MKTTRTLTIFFIFLFFVAFCFAGCKKKDEAPETSGEHQIYEPKMPRETPVTAEKPKPLSDSKSEHFNEPELIRRSESLDKGLSPNAPSRDWELWDQDDDWEQPIEPSNTDQYAEYKINKFKSPLENPFSTFSIDVDTASYTIMRQKIRSGQLPPPDSVRVEEYLNYFDYDYPAPSAGKFAVYSEISENPYNDGKTALLRIALKAKNIAREDRRPAHLVFMIDVSGSMNTQNRLPLARETLKILVNNLNDRDTVAITTYASGAQILLEPTSIDNKDEIIRVIDSLRAAGATYGEAGLRNAYAVANKGFVKGHINRIIMCTDGDFNVGIVDGKSLNDAVNKYVKKGITFSALGFGMGNYKDHRIAQIAKAGNGNYFYIDDIKEARRIFETNITSTLDVVAADVKIQLEFNPAIVSEYRLMGYEMRALRDDQFRDDLVDAGEVGPGHSVTAVYELKLFDKPQNIEIPKSLVGKAAMFNIRYKESLTDEKAVEVNFPIENKISKFDSASKSFKFATAVAGFADIIRGSEFAEGWRLSRSLDAAEAGAVKTKAYADEFIELVRKAISFRDR